MGFAKQKKRIHKKNQTISSLAFTFHIMVKSKNQNYSWPLLHH